MKSIGERLRKARDKAGLSLGQVHQYEGIQKGHLSEMERGLKSPTAETLIRLARRYHTSADYLLGLDGSPAEELPAVVREIIGLAQDLSPSRQAELLAHAQILAEAELQADLREYDRMMALVMALPDGDLLRETVDEALRVAATDGAAAALRVIDALLARRAAQTEPGQQQVEQR